MLDGSNILLMLAIVLVAGTVSGLLVRMVGLPSVTGQIVAGVLLGPSVAGVMTLQNLHALDPFVDFALGLMAVAVGSHLNFRRLRVARQRLAMLLLLESVLTPLFVFGGLMLFGDVSWSTALLLATIAISTAPATVLAIVRETGSRGPFVTTLVAAVALNNLACIILFELSRTIAGIGMTPPGMQAAPNLWLPFSQIAQSILLGAGIGLALILTTLRIVRTDRLTVLSLIAILLTTGLTEQLGLSVLLACLTLGITIANVTPDREEIGHRVFESFESAIFAVFFVVAGMELHFESLTHGGVLAGICFAGRLSGKVLAGYLGMTLAGATLRLRRWIGMALTPQAGLAVGLMLLVTEDPAFVQIHELFLAVVLASVLMNEMVGPVLTRIGLKYSGDVGRERSRVLDFLSEHNITTDLRGPDKESAIRQLVKLTVDVHQIPMDVDSIMESVLQAEAAASSCVGSGLALPHARLPFGDRVIGAMGISREGLHLDAPDGRPVHCMVLILTPTSMPERHLQVLQALAASIGRDRAIQQQLYHIDSPAHADELIHADRYFETWNDYLDDD